MRHKHNKLFWIFFLVFSTSLVEVSKNYQVECYSLNSNGYIEISIWNTAKGRCYTIKNAQKDAIHAILYSGVPATKDCQTQIPMLNTSKEIERFKKIESEFFSRKGKWRTFTRSSLVVKKNEQERSTKKLKTYRVSISKDQLRKYLEEIKVLDTLPRKGF